MVIVTKMKVDNFLRRVSKFRDNYTNHLYTFNLLSMFPTF